MCVAFSNYLHIEITHNISLIAIKCISVKKMMPFMIPEFFAKSWIGLENCVKILCLDVLK
jgi:hypothetical protein